MRFPFNSDRYSIVQEYRKSCIESATELSSLRGSFDKEISSLQFVHSLKEEFATFKLEQDSNFLSLNQRIDHLQSAENNFRGEMNTFSNKLVQLKQDQYNASEELSSQIHKSQQKLIELNSLIQPLLNTPQAISDLSRVTQQLEIYTRQHNEETIQLHKALQSTQQLFSQKLQLEETARISELTGLSNELRTLQLHFSQAPLQGNPFLPSNQLQFINAPPPKPSTLHIPKQPSLNLASLPSSYEHLTSVSLPSTCTNVSILFPNPSKLPHSTPKSNPTSLTDLKYTTSPIDGEMRVISSIQEQKEGGSTETSNEESPSSIADKFQALGEESGFSPLVQEHVPFIPSSPKESKRENTQSAQDRVLSIIREESETQVSSEVNLEASYSKKGLASALPILAQQETNDDFPNQETEGDVLSPLPQVRSESSGSFFSRHLSLPESLGRDKPTREYRRLRTVESIVRQSFIKSPEPPKDGDGLLDLGEDEGLNEWGIYQVIFWVRLKSRWMRPVLRLRETL